MKMYLSHLIKIEGIEKVYCINAFFNAGNNPDKRVSEISYIDHYENEHKNLKDHPKVTPKDIELTEHSPVNLHRNSSRISRILDDPGNEIYDWFKYSYKFITDVFFGLQNLCPLNDFDDKIVFGLKEEEVGDVV